MKRLLLALTLLLLALPARAAGGTTVLPLLWYTFDSNDLSGASVTDYSGSGNTGTITGALANPSGALGQALSFTVSGLTNYVTAKNGRILSGDSALTMSAWIKTTATNNANGRAIYGERAASGNDILKLDSFVNGICPSSVLLTIRNDAGTVLQGACATSKPVNDGKWHFVAITVNGTAVVTYVDGIQRNTGNWTGGTTFTNASVQSRIGSDIVDTLNTTGTGVIDNVELFSSAVSAAQVMQMYYQGLARHSKFL